MDRAALEEVAEEVRHCTLCALAESRNLAVPGEGSGDNGLVLIGEGPGAEEDARGRPFVGRAGGVLDGLLESAGIVREECFVTNVVKCRPPRNRAPMVDERRTCVDAHLRRQIKALEPKLICLLGNTAVQTVLGERSLGGVVGRRIVKGEQVFFVTYHPAAVLYNPELLGDIRDHMRRLSKILSESEAVRSRDGHTSLDTFL